jgi:transcription elongation factor Elf1
MSLVTTPTRQLATCAVCAGHRVTRLSMTLTDGSEVDFVSCHVCEHKSWTEAGTGLDVSDVLRKAQKPAKAAR